MTPLNPSFVKLFVFDQSSGAGTYEAKLPLKAPFIIADVVIHNESLWTGTGAVLNAGDNSDGGGYFQSLDITTSPLPDSNGAGGASNFKGDSVGSAYSGFTVRYDADDTITVTITQSGTGSSGFTYVYIFYSLPAPEIVDKL